MNKKQLLDEIKRIAKESYSEIILLHYKGENVASLEVPCKKDHETMSEYMEKYEVTPRGKGEYLLTIKIGWGSINILIDNFGGI